LSSSGNSGSTSGDAATWTTFTASVLQEFLQIHDLVLEGIVGNVQSLLDIKKVFSPKLTTILFETTSQVSKIYSHTTKSTPVARVIVKASALSTFTATPDKSAFLSRSLQRAAFVGGSAGGKRVNVASLSVSLKKAFTSGLQSELESLLQQKLASQLIPIWSKVSDEVSADKAVSLLYPALSSSALNDTVYVGDKLYYFFELEESTMGVNIDRLQNGSYFNAYAWDEAALGSLEQITAVGVYSSDVTEMEEQYYATMNLTFVIQGKNNWDEAKYIAADFRFTMLEWIWNGTIDGDYYGGDYKRILDSMKIDSADIVSGGWYRPPSIIARFSLTLGIDFIKDLTDDVRFQGIDQQFFPKCDARNRGSCSIDLSYRTLNESSWSCLFDGCYEQNTQNNTVTFQVSVVPDDMQMFVNNVSNIFMRSLRIADPDSVHVGVSGRQRKLLSFAVTVTLSGTKRQTDRRTARLVDDNDNSIRNQLTQELETVNFVPGSLVVGTTAYPSPPPPYVYKPTIKNDTGQIPSRMLYFQLLLFSLLILIS
jgi:hypothetical protein